MKEEARIKNDKRTEDKKNFLLVNKEWLSEEVLHKVQKSRVVSRLALRERKIEGVRLMYANVGGVILKGWTKKLFKIK